MSSSQAPFVLHATCPLGNFPASDPESLYLAALLQISVPHRWAIQQGDYGDNGGKLPFITHHQHTVSTRVLSNIPAWRDVDEDLAEEEKGEALCWKAYIEQSLTDIVNHTLYSLPPNYPTIVAPAQLGSLGALERHYVPQRIRAMHRARLEHIGLWGLAGLNDGDARDTDKARLEESFITGPAGTQAPRAWSGWRSGKESAERRKKFGEDELRRKVKGVLDPLTRRLSRGEGYMFGTKPSSTDLYLFAHLALLLTPSYPNALVAEYIKSDYPTLIDHTKRLQTLLFPDWRIPRIQPSPPPTWSDTLRDWWATPKKDAGNDNVKKEKSAAEIKFERGRWLWFAAAVVAMVGYVFGAGIVRIEFGEEGEGQEEEEGEGEGEGEEEGWELVVDEQGEGEGQAEEVVFIDDEDEEDEDE